MLCETRSFGELLLIVVLAIGLLWLFTAVGLPDWVAAGLAVVVVVPLDRRSSTR